MAKRKKKKKIYAVLVSFVFLGVIVFVSYMLTNCFLSVYDMYLQKKELADKLSKLEKDEEKLKSEVDKLNDKEYIARYAREKYLYSSDGEYIIKLPSEDEKTEKK